MLRSKLILPALLCGFFSTATYPATTGEPAPRFTLQHIFDGREISLNEYRGQVVYLDFWASWCGPCLKSFPFMNTLQKDYGEQGLVVIAVSLDEKAEDATEFLAENPVSFLVAQNAEGNLAEEYGVIAMPTSYLIGRNGTIHEIHNGFRSDDEAELRDLIVNML